MKTHTAAAAAAALLISTGCAQMPPAGQRHRVLLWGGTAFNFGKDVPRLQSYIDAADRMADVAAKQGVDGMISNHSGYDDSLRKMDALRRGAAPNPFVIGNDAVVRGLQAMESCAKAQRDRFVMS